MTCEGNVADRLDGLGCPMSMLHNPFRTLDSLREAQQAMTRVFSRTAERA